MERATLESFLAPIQKRLGHETVPKHVKPFDYKKDAPKRVTDGLAHRDLVQMFCDEAEKVAVDVHRCKSADVAQVVADIITASGGQGSVVYASDKRLERLGIPAALDECDRATDVIRWDGAQGRDAMVQACDSARFGITFAEGGIAETGTIVQPCSAACGRSISLLPLAHIAVVNASDIKATLGDWLEVIDEAGASHGDELPSQVCFITGPSVTSDIELVRVEGVHGPMYVHYVVIEGRGLHAGV